MEKQMKTFYFDPRNAASFGSGELLYRALQVTPKSRGGVESWLRSQNAYTLHKPVTRKFKRRKVIVGGKDHRWQCDLVDVKSFKNRNINFLLTVIDVFSKYAWVEPVSDKTNNSMIKAFTKIFSKSKRKPFKLQSDHGGEFTGKAFYAFLKRHGVEWFSTWNMETKATVVERFNRTLMGKLAKHMTHTGNTDFVRVLPDLVHAYNSRKHTSTGFPPESVNAENSEQVWTRLYEDNSHSRVMLNESLREKPIPLESNVRLVQNKKLFGKGYNQGWTDEVFTVCKILNTRPKTYRVKDFAEEIIEGTFYKQELQQINPVEYMIEKIIKTRKKGKSKEHFVKWKGYPSSANAWVSDKMMVNL